jgi:hypothetical protein
MWHFPKTLVAAGALFLLAGGRGVAQGPSAAVPEDPQVTPESSLLPAPRALSGPFGFSDPCPPDAAPGGPAVPAAPTAPAVVVPPPLFAHTGPYPPLGAIMHEHFQTQVNNGIAARMVLFDYDFVCGGEMLNVRGLDHLQHISHFFGSYPYPLVIERTPYTPALAEARRQMVLHLLGEQGVALPPARVVIGPPLSFPLRGVEAEIIYNNLLLQTRSRGLIIQGPGGTTGGASPTGGALPTGGESSGIPTR